jgi:hypothetical protein
MNLQQVIDQVGTSAGIAPQTAETAVGIILNVIAQELDPTQASAIFAKLPGASDLAAAHPVQAGGGGLLGSIAGAVLGNKGAVAMAGLTQLEGLGLSTAQIANLGQTIKAFITKNGGAGALGQIANAIPGLSHIFG